MFDSVLITKSLRTGLFITEGVKEKGQSIIINQGVQYTALLWSILPRFLFYIFQIIGLFDTHLGHFDHSLTPFLAFLTHLRFNISPFLNLV